MTSENTTKNLDQNLDQNKDTVPNKGWITKTLKDNKTGLLSYGRFCLKKLSVKQPKDNPTFLMVEIRKYYRNRNKKSDEGVYLVEREYEYLTSILPYGKHREQIYESVNGNRKLVISPNQNNGGVDIQQTIKKTLYDNGNPFIKENKRFVRLTRSEIEKIIENYGKLENFVDNYYDETYFEEWNDCEEMDASATPSQPTDQPQQ